METSAQATQAITITLPILADGERYAGIVLDEAGNPKHHLILLPEESEHTWHMGIEWAKAQGAELPTRQDLALLYANLKDEFKGEGEESVYWSGEQGPGHINGAWGQWFAHGYQREVHKSFFGHVRAIRRVPIA